MSQDLPIYQNFRLEIDKNRILWLGVDRKDAAVNSLNRELFSELDSILNNIPEMNLAGLVIYSAKEKGFIAGADITQFTHLKTKEEAFDLIRQAQLVLDKLAALKIPTVAMVKGFCLGGGFELALACRYRIAEDSAATIIGLPEIKLGIHPGWGGTVRLAKLVGAIESMKMILPGEAYPAKKAYKIGMVDEAVPLRELKRAATYYVLKQPPAHQPNRIGRWSNGEFVRWILGKVFYQQLKAKHVIKAHYPAPFAVIENWVRYGIGAEAMVHEAQSIAELMLTETARNLVRIFFLQEKLKGLAKGTAFKPKRVHVIGAGTMGGDIAAWCAYKGFTVTLQDQSAEKIAPAIKRAYQLFEKKLREPRLIQAAMDRLIPDITSAGINKADVVIEAIFENLAVKQKLFSGLEKEIKAETLLATNTSSLPLEQISEALKDNSQLVGMHFFNPVAKMLLVEVVKGANTAPNKVQQATTMVGQLGRLPLPVKSSPGFLINRILMPYLMEAMYLLQEGHSARSIDHAAIEFGMPMGPVTLADKVGLDVCLSVAENLLQYYGGTVPEQLKIMVKEGHLGVKTNRGFYNYVNGKQVTERSGKETQNTDMTDRMILRLVNEAVACLAENVVENADLLDAGMIFGTGFAPFRGGPIQYARTRGKEAILARLQEFTVQYGERFKPAPGWEKI